MYGDSKQKTHHLCIDELFSLSPQTTVEDFEESSPNKTAENERKFPASSKKIRRMEHIKYLSSVNKEILLAKVW